MARPPTTNPSRRCSARSTWTSTLERLGNEAWAQRELMRDGPAFREAMKEAVAHGHEVDAMVARPRARAELLQAQAAARREPRQPVGMAPQGVAAIAGAAYLAGLITPQTGIAAMLRAFHGASANVQSPARSGSGPPPATSPPAAS